MLVDFIHIHVAHPSFWDTQRLYSGTCHSHAATETINASIAMYFWRFITEHNFTLIYDKMLLFVSTYFNVFPCK